MAGGAAPVLAVRTPAGLDLLGDGEWLVAPRRHGSLAILLRTLASQPATAGEWAARQHRRAGDGDARHAGRTAAAVQAALASAPAGEVVRDRGGSPPGTAVVLSDWSAGPLLDYLLARAAVPGTTTGAPRFLAARPGPLSAPLGVAVSPLDAAAVVGPDPVDVLVAVSDSRADSVNVAFAEMYGFPVVTAEARLFAGYVDARGPHATLPLVDPAGTLTPHDLVLLRLAGRRPAGSGMAALSAAVRALVVTSEGARRRIVTEGGSATACPPRSPGRRGADDPRARRRAREQLGVSAEAIVLGTLAHGGDPARSAERVIAAAGWLDLWGRPAVVLLPAWTPPEERDRLARLASDLGCGSPPRFVPAAGEAGVSLLVQASDVLVHLGEPDEGEGPETVWTAGLRHLVTSAPSARPGAGWIVHPDVTPLLLAEQALEVVAVDRGAADPDEPGAAASGAQATEGSGPEWASQILDLVRGAP
jgi:hypothetical protein